MIVLNERAFAEEILRKKSLSNKPYYELFVLAKYFYHCKEYRKEKIEPLLIEFTRKYCPAYKGNRLKWNIEIAKIVKNAGKHRLYENDGVWITQAELTTITDIHDKVLERLAFVLLCIAKLNNLRNPNNNGWVNHDVKEVFSLAHISCGKTARFEKLNQLHRLGLLEFPRRLDVINYRVTFIDKDSELEYFIFDFRELGYEYMKICGEDFIRCQECGILIRNNKNGTKKYCQDCASYTPKGVKTLVCVDCGQEVRIKAKNTRAIRCGECQKAYRREKVLENVHRYRESKKV